MANIRESAQAYTPKQTHNIADLDLVRLDWPVEERTGKDNNNTEFKYNVVIVGGDEYRIPNSVLNDIKTILSAKPTQQTVKVIKKGEGMKTQYTVIPLE